MSFHVVLPSNSSTDIFPNNKLADFRVRLPRPLEFHGPYEVALEEIAHPKTNYTFEKNETYMTVQEVSMQNESVLTNVPVYMNVTPDDGGDSVAFSINDRLEAFDWKLKQDSNHFKLSYVGEKKEDIRHVISIEPRLAYALGFTDDPFLGLYMITEEETAAFYSPLLFQNKLMFVYVDIIDYQVVGHTLAPLLRICVPKNETKGDYSSERYIRPYYLPISRHRVEEIHVSVRTHSGEIYKFPTGPPLICKLHFRPQKR